MNVHGEPTWHVDADDLLAYRRGEIGGVSADSIEAHLLRCGSCRATLTGGASSERRELRWAAIADTIDRPTRWNRSTTWVRLSLGTPQLALAGLVLAVTSLFVPLGIGLLDTRAAVICYFALAPAAPIAGVLLAYRAAADPAGELAAATPLHTLTVVVMRAAVLLGAVLPAGILTGALLPGHTTYLLGWFLPGLAACAVILAAGTHFDPRWVAGSLATGWAALVWTGFSRRRFLPVTEVLPELAVNHTVVQAVSAAVAVAAIAYFTSRRDDLAYGGVHA